GLRTLLDRAAARSAADLDLAPILEQLAAPAVAPPRASAPPAEAPRRSRPPAERGAPSAPPAAAARHTLRIDFDKLDLLLNLVGELVVSKARPHPGLASLSSLPRALGGRRRRARRRPGRQPALAAGPAPLPEELSRLQRLLGAVVHE